MLQEDHSSNISTLFNSLPEHEDLFFGTITVESDDNDVERDGGGASWLSKLVPRVFKRTRSMNVIEQVQPKTDNTVDVTVKQFTRDNTLKFYYRTKIMEAIDDGRMVLEAVDSPTTPVGGAFIHEGCEDEFCSTSHLRNETKSLYVVLSYKDLQLKCVDKDGIDDANLHTFITIYSTNLANPGDPDTALYFPAKEEGKTYHYYLIPQDSPHPESTIMVGKVCIDKLSKEQLEDMNRKHLVFTQSYRNKGDIGASSRGFVHTTPSQLPCDVERD